MTFVSMNGFTDRWPRRDRICSRREGSSEAPRFRVAHARGYRSSRFRFGEWRRIRCRCCPRPSNPGLSTSFFGSLTARLLPHFATCKSASMIYFEMYIHVAGCGCQTRLSTSRPQPIDSLPGIGNQLEQIANEKSLPLSHAALSERIVVLRRTITSSRPAIRPRPTASHGSRGSAWSVRLDKVRAAPGHAHDSTAASTSPGI